MKQHPQIKNSKSKSKYLYLHIKVFQNYIQSFQSMFMQIFRLLGKRVNQPACTTSLGKSFHLLTYEERELVATLCSYFYIKFIVVIGSGSVKLGKLKKIMHEMEGYTIQTLSCSIELKIKTSRALISKVCQF